MSFRSAFSLFRRALDVPWPAFCGLCFATLAALDRALAAPLGAGVFWAFCAGAGSGLLLGVLSGAVAWSLRRQQPLVAALPWFLLSALAGVGLARDLGVLARFEGAYRALAVLATLGCFAVALFGGALGFALQPSRVHADGFLLSRSTKLRVGASLGLLFVAVACGFVDRTFETSAYPLAHDALRFVSLASLVSSAWFVAHRRLRRVPAVTATLLVSALGTFTLTAKASTELARIERRPYASLALRVVQTATDFDMDGHSTFFGGGDCRGFDAAVSPSREEVPGNGVDDNCRRGDAKRRASTTAEVPIPHTASPSSVVLITVDTLAARRMSLYGAKRSTTPKLEKWAESAVVFERAYSSGGWTSLAIPSLMRGLYPRRLDWTRLIETNRFSLLRVNETAPDGESMKTSFGLPLEDPHRPLAFWLQRRGMFTAAVVNDRQSEFLDPRFLGEGFDEYVDLDVLAGENSNDTDVTNAALGVLQRLPEDRRFFLWVHYFGPHKPDERHDAVPDFGNGRGARYDHEVAFADLEVHRLLEALESDPRSKDATVFVTADHGEHIRGDWRGHGGDVHEATIHIPLVMRTNGVEPGRVNTPVSLVDLFPTILAVTGTPAPESDGIDLRSVAQGKTKGRVLFSETWRFNARGSIINDRVGAFDGKYKLERDNLRDVTGFVRQWDSQKAISEERIPKQSRRLRDALEGYLEENGVIRMKD
jgi:hypothetical protein